MAEFTADKTIDPTTRRHEQAREQGHVARSQDVVSVAVLLTCTLSLFVLLPAMARYMVDLTSRQLGGSAWTSVEVATAEQSWVAILLSLSRVLLPILGLAMFAAILGNLVQGGLRFLPARVAPDLTRINATMGLARLFSLSTLARLAFGLVKLAVVGAVACYVVAARWEEILVCGQMALPELAIWMADIVLWTTFKIVLALGVVAIFDYGFQWWRHERDLRMTPQELREEMRSQQGDAQIAARRRALQLRLKKDRD